ncbi:hypothetical protein [Spirilliplanes yamanashiensis]|uniref:Uncharacterized protein n=1 Tax=Spirilliplanes yamanashiensis TaxID=42233 RepID=A0A8J4DMK5_9ACTN|nr:hypothetical protein [Spirilliplanes yamanashiensis]MDP9816777.1 hypothetical protein [Spirilliplanes yamanashiensis]GIJ06299.1 hypothetical protein Sya03_56510 [Spirilliplanes yamanashiensis]
MRGGVASLPPASPGVVSAGYLGSHWRLAAVTDRRGTTAIPASVGAWLELAADGTLLASDGVNVINGHVTGAGAGFDVYEAITTLVGYAGDNPAEVAAVTGIHAVTSGPPVTSSAPGDGSQAPPVHVTVLASDGEQLTVQGSGVRLTFVRTGPAGRLDMKPVPAESRSAG